MSSFSGKCKIFVSGNNPTVFPSTGRLLALFTNIRHKHNKRKLSNLYCQAMSDIYKNCLATVIPALTVVAVLVIVFFLFLIWIVPGMIL